MPLAVTFQKRHMVNPALGKLYIRPVHKRRPQSAGRSRIVQGGQFSEKGVFKCGHPHFLVEKTLNFLKFMGVRTDKGVETVRSFAEKEELGGSIFRDFMRTSFMDGPLLYFFSAHFLL